MITLKNVSKSYKNTTALQPTNLSIQEGTTTVLIGPSGCGKSTLLKTIIHLIEPTTGEVIIDGIPVTSTNANAVRKKIGYVIQEGGLFPHLTCYANISLMAQVIGWKEEQCRARIAELADLTQIPQELLTRFPLQLSGGQRQRISLMRALMLDPSILLLDEPLGALDPLIRSDLQEDLKRIFSDLNKTVVMVTHDLAEAAQFADNIVLIRDGAVIQIGSLYDLIYHPKSDFVSLFINAQRKPLEALLQ